VLAYVSYQNWPDFVSFWNRQVQWPFLFLGFALCAGSIVLTFVRWYLLVWALEFPFRLVDALRLGFIGFLFNYVAPGGAGGDLVKATLIAREQKSRRAVAVATILLDRILGMLALFIVAATACLVPTSIVDLSDFRIFIFAAWAGAIAGTLGLVVMLHPAFPRSRWLNRLVGLRYVGRTIGELINAVLLYQSKRNVLVVAVVISLAGHFGMLSAFYCCARAMNPAEGIPGYWAHLQFIPMAELFSVLVPLPGGVGALEGAVAYFYSMAGATGGVLTVLAYRVLTIFITAVGAFYYMAAQREIGEALQHSADEDLAVENTANEDPANEDPAGEDPAGEDSAGEDSAGEDPAGEDPANEDPANEDPANEDPAGEDPAGEDPAGKR
jgi:hypothetical protein